MNKQEIAETINRVRMERGMNFHQLAQRSHIDNKKTKYVAIGSHHSYNIETLISLLDALDLEIEIKERVH